MRIKSSLVNIFFPAWLIAVIIIFIFFNRFSYIQYFSIPSRDFFLQKLSQISLLPYLISLFLALVSVIFFTLACTGLGLLLIKLLSIPLTSDLAQGITAFVTGEILLSIFLLAIISKTHLSPATTATTVIICFASGFPYLKNFFQGFKWETAKFNQQQKTILGWLAAIGVLSLLLSTARLGHDAVSDYFSQAKLMAVSGEATSFFPGNYMIVSSLHPDILFTALIQMSGDQSARLLSWMNGLAILLLGYGLAKETGLSMQARLYFMVLMFTSTAFTDLLGDGKVELISTAPIVAAMYWMSHNLNSPSRGKYLLVGLLAGFAIIARLYNIFLVSAFMSIFFIIWLFHELQKKPTDNIASTIKVAWKLGRPILWIFPPLLLMGGFHLVQNWIWLGSPLAPLKFAPKLASSNWEWQFNPAILNIFRILYPITVTFVNNPQSLGGISPLFMGFLPFLLVRDIRTKIRFSTHIKYLIWAGLCTLISWIGLFYTVVEIRYIFFLWILLFLFASQIMEGAINYVSKAFSSLMRLLITLVLLFISLQVTGISLMTYSPVDSTGSAHCYDISYCTFFEPVNQVATPGERVLALNAFRYYLRSDLFACSSRANEYPGLQTLAQNNPSDFWVEVYRHGFRIIAYEKNFAIYHSRFGTIPDPRTAPSWLNISIVSSTENKDDIAYRLEARNPPFQPEISCKYDKTQKAWRLIYSSK